MLSPLSAPKTPSVRLRKEITVRETAPLFLTHFFIPLWLFLSRLSLRRSDKDESDGGDLVYMWRACAARPGPEKEEQMQKTQSVQQDHASPCSSPCRPPANSTTPSRQAGSTPLCGRRRLLPCLTPLPLATHRSSDRVWCFLLTGETFQTYE